MLSLYAICITALLLVATSVNKYDDITVIPPYGLVLRQQGTALGKDNLTTPVHDYTFLLYYDDIDLKQKF